MSREQLRAALVFILVAAGVGTVAYGGGLGGGGFGGAPGYGGGDLVAGGTATIHGNLLPGTNNTYSIGTGSLGWTSVLITGSLTNSTDSNARITITNDANTIYRGDAANSSTNAGHSFRNVTTLSTNTRIAEFHNDSAAAAAESYIAAATGAFITPAQTLTIADDAAGTNATATLTPTSGYVNCTCNDANGCDITMGETSVNDGTIITVITSTATACNFADSAGVSELAGAFAAGTYDSIRMIYLSDRWVEMSRSNN